LTYLSAFFSYKFTLCGPLCGPSPHSSCSLLCRSGPHKHVSDGQAYATTFQVFGSRYVVCMGLTHATGCRASVGLAHTSCGRFSSTSAAAICVQFLAHIYFKLLLGF